jgi:uncharacterized protein YbgA (DUF1722 family)
MWNEGNERTKVEKFHQEVKAIFLAEKAKEIKELNDSINQAKQHHRQLKTKSNKI